MSTNTIRSADGDAEQALRVRRAIRSRNFAVLSTVSAAGFPHAAGVLYVSSDDELYVHTMRTSRKARNIAGDGRVGVVVPVRKLPVGPPYTVHFQGRAEILAMEDPEVVRLIDGGRMKKISSHGELDEPVGCFLRIRPSGTVHTYGIGVSALAVAMDPLHNGRRSANL